jgi:uncharacterized protein
MRVERASANHVQFTGDVHFDVASGAAWRGAREWREPEPPVVRRGYAEAIPQLQISMTDACNMSCSYCSFRKRVHADGKPVNMPASTARKAIDFFAAEFGSSPYARIDFGLAGEPMLRRKTHSTLLEWIGEALAPTGIEVAWAGPMVTNATLALDDPDLLESLGPPQDISCDGPEEVHDTFRPYNDGSGTYQDVVKVVRHVLKKHPGIGGSAVLTARFNHFDEIFLHLHEELGFQSIYMKPVNASHDVDYGLNFETLPRFIEGYQRLIDLILAQDAEKRLAYLLTLNPEDFFMRYFYRLLNRNHQIYRCGAGKSGAYVDTNGKLYPCAHFIGKSGWDIGDVENGFDPVKQQPYIDAHVDTREPCKSCWARYLCGGGCYYQAVLAHGDFNTPDLAKCDLIRFLCTQAVRLLSTLEEETPAVLDALRAPFVVRDSEADAPANTPYTPTGVLLAGGDGIELNGPDRVEGIVRDPAASARLTLEQGEGTLTIRITSDVEWANAELWLLDVEQETFRFVDLAAGSSAPHGTRLSLSPDGTLRRLRKPAGALRRVPFLPDEWEPVAGAEVHAGDGWVEALIPLDTLLHGTPQSYGLNVELHPARGGRMLLTRLEPFLLVDASARGALRPAGPLFDRTDGDDGTLNCCASAGFIPLTRWTGLQANVC